MGSWLSGEYREEAEVKPDKEQTCADEAGPLTTRQIAVVQDTWSYVVPDLQGHGLVFLERLIAEKPDLLQLFSFNDVDIDNLKSDKRAQEQVCKIMAVLDKAVAGLHDLAALVPSLKAMGARHVRYKLLDEYYEFVGGALLYSLQKGLGSKFTDEAREAWTVVCGVVTDTMIAGAQEKRARLHSYSDSTDEEKAA